MQQCSKSLEECIWKQRDTTIHSLEELKLKRLNISFNEDVEQLELSLTSGGNAKWSNHYGGSLTISLKS